MQTFKIQLMEPINNLASCDILKENVGLAFWRVGCRSGWQHQNFASSFIISILQILCTKNNSSSFDGKLVLACLACSNYHQIISQATLDEEATDSPVSLCLLIKVLQPRHGHLLPLLFESVVRKRFEEIVSRLFGLFAFAEFPALKESVMEKAEAAIFRFKKKSHRYLSYLNFNVKN